MTVGGGEFGRGVDSAFSLERWRQMIRLQQALKYRLGRCMVHLSLCLVHDTLRSKRIEVPNTDGGENEVYNGRRVD